MIVAKAFAGFAIVMALAGANEACYRRSAAALEASSPDSVLGIVSVTGTTFEHHLVLRSKDKTIALNASLPDSAALTNLAGVEVVVRGDLDGTAMRVETFTAVRVDGAPVVDGVLGESLGQLFLKTSSGNRPLGNPPAKLREMISARVWVGGPLDRGPNNYGVIVPAAVRQ